MNPIKVIANPKGQALAEATVVMALWTVAIGVCGAILLITYNKAWLNHFTYEATVCLGKGHSTYFCEQKLKVDVQKNLLAIKEVKAQCSKDSEAFTAFESYRCTSSINPIPYLLPKFSDNIPELNAESEWSNKVLNKRGWL